MTELVVRDLGLKASNGAALVEGARFTLAPGDLVAVLGPNGAGKTSLLRASLGLQRRTQGEAWLSGRPTHALSPIQRARLLAYLPQIRPLAWPNRVRDVVALGRFSHGGGLGRLMPDDADAVERAMAACDLTHLAERRTDTLSGGELARVHCARAFAAEAPLLFADEPTAALDPRHQFRIMDLIGTFVGRGGGALVVLHDVALAARYATRLIWIKQGRILADGPPAETLTPERMAEVYGVRAQVDGLKVEIEGAL